MPDVRGCNRLIKTIDPLGGTTQQAYDQGGNLTKVIDPLSDTTVFDYDDAGRQTKMTDPLLHTAIYAYDGNGWMTSLTDRDSRSRSFVYDDDGHLLTETWYPAGSTTPIDTLLYTYDAAGNMLTAGNNQGTYALSYDPTGLVTNVVEPFGVTLTFAYDAVNNRTQVADSFGGVENSTYDWAHSLTNRVFSSGGSAVGSFQQSFYPENKIAYQMRYNSSSPAQLVATSYYAMDNAGRVTAVTHTNPGLTNLASYSYSYDPAGNVTTQIDHGVTTAYTFDDAEQLTAEGTTAYAYDAGGNRSNYTYGATYHNQLMSDGTWAYGYDFEENLTSKTKTGESWTYGYDNANELISAVHSTTGVVDISITYKYDALKNQIEKDVVQGGVSTTTRYAYDGWDPARGTPVGNENYDMWAEMDSSSNLTVRYLHNDGVDQPIARMVYVSGAYTVYWYLDDRLGSVRDVVDNSNTPTILDSTTFDVYGNFTAETGPNQASRGATAWVGYQFDPLTGWYYVRAREYDPKTGRWQQEDPIPGANANRNVYEYVGNRPSYDTDPSGMEVVTRDSYSTDNLQKWLANNTSGYFKSEGPGIDTVVARVGDPNGPESYVLHFLKKP